MTKYEEWASMFGLQKGDCVWLSSEVLGLAMMLRKQNEHFDGNALLDAFIHEVGPSGTILLPTFSFTFSNVGFYDIRNTKGTTGVLGNMALARGDFKRTKHPMHSFAVWGSDQDYLVGLENRHSFGVDSPFGYCMGKHVKQVILGTDYVQAMTMVHYAETVCNVPYRFFKTFTGTYVDMDGNESVRNYDYAARKLVVRPEERFNRIGLILEECGASKKITMDGQENYLVDLAASFPIVCTDIIDNQCRNIYDFNIPREEIFGDNTS